MQCKNDSIEVAMSHRQQPGAGTYGDSGRRCQSCKTEVAALRGAALNPGLTDVPGNVLMQVPKRWLCATGNRSRREGLSSLLKSLISGMLWAKSDKWKVKPLTPSQYWFDGPSLDLNIITLVLAVSLPSNRLVAESAMDKLVARGKPAAGRFQLTMLIWQTW